MEHHNPVGGAGTHKLRSLIAELHAGGRGSWFYRAITTVYVMHIQPGNEGSLLSACIVFCFDTFKREEMAEQGVAKSSVWYRCKPWMRMWPEQVPIFAFDMKYACGTSFFTPFLRDPTHVVLPVMTVDGEKSVGIMI
jgi:hypothetical protein